MYKLQVINTHTSRVVFSVESENEGAVKWHANAALEQFDENAGSLSHYVGLLGPGEAAPNANHVGKHPKGLCSACHGVYPINRNGRIARHGKPFGRRSTVHCVGSGKRPLPLPEDGDLPAPVRAPKTATVHYYAVLDYDTNELVDLFTSPERAVAFKLAHARTRQLGLDGATCYVKKIKALSATAARVMANSLKATP